jgi:hypothetical protein
VEDERVAGEKRHERVVLDMRRFCAGVSHMMVATDMRLLEERNSRRRRICRTADSCGAYPGQDAVLAWTDSRTLTVHRHGSSRTQQAEIHKEVTINPFSHNIERREMFLPLLEKVTKVDLKKYQTLVKYNGNVRPL